MSSCFSNIKRYRAGILILALLFFSANVMGQDTIRRVLPNLGERPTLKIEKDSTNLRQLATPTPRIMKSESPEPVVVKKEKEHSPNKALLLSLLPGAGQIYNGQAWKVPVIYAALGTMAYLVYDNYTQMAMYKEDYLYRINHNGDALIDKYAGYPNESIYNMYQSYSKNFQLMVIVSAGVYALNLVDAYVFGHLYDFQINDDISLHVAPVMQTNYYQMGLSATPSLRFSLRF